ncbi:MAG: biotin--[acetyl-CoA-carboxylase] ligase [Acidobacteria bacterium]|nr:biotin--[acetyl-CoA-carboxylase] ligase [Acidobacteriota bacterium]
MHFQLVHFNTLDSTNREAADQARAGAAEGLTIVADEQTAGRGRQGREWASATGSGAYFTTILHPRVEVRHFTLIPLMAAVAVYDALLERWHIGPDIKWPNDVLVDEKKIAGILAEMVDTPTGNAIVVGIGINLRAADPELNATAIEGESKVLVARDEVVLAVLEQLGTLYTRLHEKPASILDEWSSRSSYFDGKAVNVDLGNNDSFSGVTCGLEENGALRVRDRHGSVRIVQAGDLTRLRQV